LTSLNIKNYYFILFDQSYSKTLTCDVAQCPIVKVQCEMPFDWYPKQMSYDTSVSPPMA
jgi:hypothetical protein